VRTSRQITGNVDINVNTNNVHDNPAKSIQLSTDKPLIHVLWLNGVLKVLTEKDDSCLFSSFCIYDIRKSFFPSQILLGGIWKLCKQMYQDLLHNQIEGFVFLVDLYTINILH